MRGRHAANRNANSDRVTVLSKYRVRDYHEHSSNYELRVFLEAVIIYSLIINDLHMNSNADPCVPSTFLLQHTKVFPLNVWVPHSPHSPFTALEQAVELLNGRALSCLSPPLVHFYPILFRLTHTRCHSVAERRHLPLI